MKPIYYIVEVQRMARTYLGWSPAITYTLRSSAKIFGEVVVESKAERYATEEEAEAAAVLYAAVYPEVMGHLKVVCKVDGLSSGINV